MSRPTESMAKHGGLILLFDEDQRAALLRERIQGNQSFSETLSAPDWKFGTLELCLLTFTPSNIDFICLARRGKRVATAKARVEFLDLVALDLNVDKLQAVLKVEIKAYFIRASRGLGGLVPAQSWSEIVAGIKELRPDTAEEIERLIALRNYSGYRLAGEFSEILLQEREALGAALDIFSGSNQLRSAVLSRWAPNPDSVKDMNEETMRGKLIALQEKMSFSTSVFSRFQEESALQHDLFNWPAMTPMHVTGTSTFLQGDRILQIVYANRNALEKTLGVDLIYFNQEYELFALVQYKLMREENEVMIYRPDHQLIEELKRMDEFIKLYQLTTELKSHEEFRLNADGFLVKLVPNHGLQPGSGELIKGMYITREYMKFLLGPNGPKGDKGGIAIGFDNAPRYLTNTEFTHAVNRGWLGMRRLHSKALRDLLRQYYETKRAVLLAYEKPKASNYDAATIEQLALF